MKIYRIIVIILSIAVGIGSNVWVYLTSPVVKPTITGAITSESYQTLKDYAFEFATNGDTEPREGIIVTSNFTEETLTIKVDEEIYGIEAIFPISKFERKIENGILSYVAIIDYNNVTYLEHTVIESPYKYIITMIALAIMSAILVYMVLYVAVYGMKKILKGEYSQ